MTDRDPWIDHTISQLHLPDSVIVAVVKRGDRILVPRGNMILRSDDIMVLGAESYQDDKEHIKLKEFLLQKNHPWIGKTIRSLEISRHSIIVLIRRNRKVMIPNGNMILRENDTVILYTQSYLGGDGDIEI